MTEPNRWKPHVTVAAFIEQEGRLLLVEERDAGRLMLNNPAGHLEPGETPQQAVVREVLEETARVFVPQAIVGLYLSRTPAGHAADITYLRIAFCGTVGDALPGRALDAGIEQAVWMSPAQIRASVARHRSPMLLRGLDDYVAGRRLPLDLIKTDGSLVR